MPALPARNTVSIGPGVTEIKTSGRMLLRRSTAPARSNPGAAVEFQFQSLRR